MSNPYAKMTRDELLVINQGILKTIMRGWDNDKEKPNEDQIQIWSNIIRNITAELKKRG